MSKTVVEARDLRFAWQPSVPLLDISELTIGVGERVFVHGSSGSGKTTLLNLIAGLLLPQAGSLRLAGQELTTMSAGDRDLLRGNQLGFVFQMFNLLPYLTPLDNVIAACAFAPAKRQRVATDGNSLTATARQLLQTLQLDEALISSQRTATLSIGQQQRVAIARALIGKPVLVIADEPTSALDHQLQSLFLDLLFEQCRLAKSSLLFVSHDLKIGERFDRTIALAEVNRR